MQSCELVMFVSSVACCIAQDRSSDEIALLASIFTLLGDSLAAIAAQQDFCRNLNEEKDTS
jgi:hypothetical protein